METRFPHRLGWFQFYSMQKLFRRFKCLYAESLYFQQYKYRNRVSFKNNGIRDCCRASWNHVFALQENMWLTLVLRWQTFIILMTTLVLQEISTNGWFKWALPVNCIIKPREIHSMMNCFVVWLTDKRCLVLFPAGTIARDSHHRESPARRMQDLNLRRTWVQALLDEVVQQR